MFLGLAAIMSATSGLWMIAMPRSWFHAIPGVSGTGPFNGHFVTDVGLAYLVSGGCLAVAAMWPARRDHGLPGAAFLAGHAMYHLIAARHWTNAATALTESVGIYMPVVLAAAGLLCLRRQSPSG